MVNNPKINLNPSFSNSNLIDSINNINCIKTHNYIAQNLKLSQYKKIPKDQTQHKSKLRISQFNNE